LPQHTQWLAQPAEQKHLGWIHTSSSVGARPSSAAPVEQNHLQLKSWTPYRVVIRTQMFWLEYLRLSAALRWSGGSSIHHSYFVRVLFDGGGRGRTRSGRRAGV